MKDQNNNITIIKIPKPDDTGLKDYLGDGVYALFDGYGIWLHANDHENPTDRVYLEPSVLEALNRFNKRCISEINTSTEQKNNQNKD